MPISFGADLGGLSLQFLLYTYVYAFQFGLYNL